jgi:hypothetical protein
MSVYIVPTISFPEALDNPLTPAVDQLGSIGSRYFVPEPTFLQVQRQNAGRD